jgi:two-component system, OmpR family, sensor kinase
VTRHGRIGQEHKELDVIGEMRTLLAETHRTVDRIFAVHDSGRREEAAKLFETEIEDQLDDAFQKLLAAAVAGERQEVAEAEEEAAAMLRRTLVTVAALVLAALAASALAAYYLNRSLSRPIQRLNEGAIALGRGDLSYRIGDLGQDELGLLAARFDDMSGMLLAARSELERQVRERTSELERANRRLRELDHLRVQFLADISHELRTPLTVLRGEAEVTLRGTALAETSYRDALTRIAAQASDMGRLVDDLLFLTRMETDTLRLERRLLRLDELLVQTIQDAEVLARGKDLGMDAEIPEVPVLVEGDGGRLKQALMIGLDNAVKYSDPRGRVTTSLEAKAGRATITICNGGTAVPAEDLPYVFERYFRGVRMRTSEGSGLGLPIAKWIFEKHGGTIALTSEPGGRTELRICLPLAA